MNFLLSFKQVIYSNVFASMGMFKKTFFNLQLKLVNESVFVEYFILLSWMSSSSHTKFWPKTYIKDNKNMPVLFQVCFN